MVEHRIIFILSINGRRGLLTAPTGLGHLAFVKKLNKNRKL